MSKTIEVKQLDAFTTVPFAGNPAGVVLQADGLDPDVMQRIAREMNCSETVFVLPSQSADLRMRYFTPAVEVDLCGHATIAGLTALASDRGLSGAITVETNAGLLDMEGRADGTVWMRQAKPQFREVDSQVRQQVAAYLGIGDDAFGTETPLGLAYTGLWDLMVPVQSLAVLRGLQPNLDRLAVLNRTLGAASTHVYCLETETQEAVLHARDFSPAVGVPEDPHTGTASGALGAWLVHNGVLQGGAYVFEQGWSVGRPGLIQVQVDDAASTVWVGGRAVEVLSGRMVLE